MAKEEKPTIQDVLNLLTHEQYEVASMLNELANELDLKAEAKIGRRERYKLIYSTKKPKRALFRFEASPTSWRVKANLFNIDEYSDLTENANETIKNHIKETRECTSCNDRCKKDAFFSLDGKKYSPCIGSGHYFKGDMSKDDWENLAELIKAENAVL